MKRVRGELELIERIRAGSAETRRGSGVVLGIGDDCAVLRPPRGHEVMVTTDFSLEGRHFRRDWHSAESAGHRALARGLSDLAAMGARPLGAFLSLALPREMVSTAGGRRWVDGFLAGLQGLAREAGTSLAGGDTSESPCGLVLADIVLVGSAPRGCALRRSGGRPGDLLYVTGSLGGAAAELETLARTSGRRIVRSAAGTVRPQLFPEPRLTAGQTLLRRGLATAAIDLSDGLSTDLAHLCRASEVGAEIAAEALPLHALALAAGAERGLQLALNGGEDYELLFAAPAKVRMPRCVSGVPVTPIGRLVRGDEITLLGGRGARTALRAAGWQHFVRR